jgi:eps4I
MNFFSGKTILVTGATGLIGSNLIDNLMRIKEVKIIALSLTEEKIKKSFKKYIGKENFKYIARDISLGINDLTETIDICFHAAGSTEGSKVSNYPVDIIMPNLIGIKNCCDFMVSQYKNKKVKGRLVLFSSATIYANNTNKDLVVKEKDTNYTEELNGNNASYSQSKRMVEVIAQAYKKQFNIDFVTARFSYVYGNTKSIPNTAFFEFIKKCIKREDILINKSNTPKRDNIYIDDAIEALLIVSEKGVTGEAYNISSNQEKGNYLAIDEIANIIAEISNEYYSKTENFRSISVLLKENISKRTPGLILDNTKLKSLGWNLKTDFREGIRKILENIDTKN